MSLISLSVTLVFVALALVVSVWQKLGLQKDLVVATVRATIQLLAIGYVLKAVFALNDPVFIVLMIVLMIVVAAWNASKRGGGTRSVLIRVACAIAFTELVTQGLLLALHILPWRPRYVIPVSGMIIGNSMIIASLFLNRLNGELDARRQEVLVLLSLGGTPRQSVAHVLKSSVRSSMIPTIDSMKTTGLVQLPGMMTGQIIAGADPIQAVRYQLLILFALLTAAAITSMTLAVLIYPTLFNRYHQLLEMPRKKV